MIRLIIRIVIIAAIGLLLVNELGRWVQGEAMLHDATDQVIQFGQQNGHRFGRDVAAEQAQGIAQQNGITLLSYGQTETQVFVVTQTQVHNSLIVGPIIAFFRHQPLSTPYTLQAQGGGTMLQ